MLTALGLAVGIALVIAVSALSAGLDNAQAKVLKPLTGVGTDMSVTRPVRITNGNLSSSERAQLRREGGPGRVGFGNLKAGSKFTRTDYMSSELTFPAAKVAAVKKLANVSNAVGGLNLNLTAVSGSVPKQSALQQGPPTAGGPRSVSFNSIAVSGVDPTSTTLGAITSDELTKGTWFTSATKRQAILNVNYATQKNKHVGDTIKLSGKIYAVVGIAKTPVGGSSSDVYIDLTQLQKMSSRTGRINTMYVRATSASKVDAVSKSISKTISGASVTTAESLAAQITGTLSTAKSLTGKLGLALEAVALIGSLMIASLLTLTSVSKRFRELGTLKAIGWQQRTIVRQIAGESLFQGFLGGVLGVVLGLVAAAAITAFGPELKATFDSGGSNNGPFFGPPGAQRAVANAASTTVKLAADVSPALIVGAVGLAIVGGLLSGTVGALRAARLRPADALRHID
jgi:putative ABC transport system permease protein